MEWGSSGSGQWGRPTCSFTLGNNPYFQLAVLPTGGQSKLHTAAICRTKTATFPRSQRSRSTDFNNKRRQISSDGLFVKCNSTWQGIFYAACGINIVFGLKPDFRNKNMVFIPQTWQRTNTVNVISDSRIKCNRRKFYLCRMNLCYARWN